jgi:hypothetical protein
VTELRHGIALAEQVAMDLIDSEQNPYVRRVLSEVPEFMRTRRRFTFITCFCGIKDSAYHSKKYASVCFRFDIPPQWHPELECQDSRAESWYSPVFYKERDQIRAIKLFLKDVSHLLVKHTNGAPEEDRAGWIANGPIRDIGQCLLTLVSCFKREVHERDREWRLIFTPNLALSSTAPKMADDSFDSCIVKSRSNIFAFGRFTLIL